MPRQRWPGAGRAPVASSGARPGLDRGFAGFALVSTQSQQPPHHHLAGVGAGPANLSLAALGEHVVPGGVALYDRRQGPAWHPQLMHPGVRLQTSWIKDLATLVDPCNRLTFLSYLVSTGRIYAFITAQFSEVPRLEYARYLAWASERLGVVRYGVDVDEIDFDGDRFLLRSRGCQVASSEHLVLGLGTEPRVPACFAGSDPGLLDGALLDGVLLAEDLDGHLSANPPPRHEQVIVVGGGQTGAECVLSLLDRGYRDIRWLGRRHWFAPLDDSPSANDFYRPMYLRFFHGLSGETRQRYVAEEMLTTDGIAMSTLQRLYQANYEFFLREGRAPVMMLPGRNVLGAANRDATVTLWCQRDAGGRERHTARHVVLATGRQPSPLPFAERLTELMDLDEHGEPVIEQDYSVRWKHGPEHRIFLQNRGRLSHGVVDPNLSLLSVRSAMILNSLCEREVFTIRDELVNTLWA